MSTLTALATQVARGAITIADAGSRAREVTAGRITTVNGVASRVVSSMKKVEEELASLTNHMNTRPYTDVERWAGAFVMVHALLGNGNLENAAELARRIASTKPLPDGATELVVAAIDSVLSDAALPPALVDQLIARRRVLLGSGEPVSPGRASDVIVECFDREGWAYHLDREQSKILIEFFFPFGRTTLVCSVSPDDELTIFALEVVRVEEQQMRAMTTTLAGRFPGVRSERDEHRGTVTLYYALPGASGLTRHEVRKAVVHVNGAAEHLIMMARGTR